ncbi:MAG: hypothetical protein H0U49_09285, partial [Parachlamydiaceae bacterium]|nr:hypothetical protein [Parachlamydiaceae bacterium]
YRYGENRGNQQGLENSAGYVGNPVYVEPPVQYGPNGNPNPPGGNDNWGQ